MNDSFFMELAIREARATIGRTSPNPPVGAALVRQGRVLAVGRTAPPGGPHAEIVAMRRANVSVRGATLYTTLEPCCHHGRTGPCTEAIIGEGISRVVVGCKDRNPSVSGLGIDALKKAGIEVELGVLADACERIALPFFTWVIEKRPYVVLKAAVTLDGRLATNTGDSRWISGEKSREKVHGWRNKFDAIIVGSGTVMADDPALTTRLTRNEGRDPIRIVLDPHLMTDPNSRVYRQSSDAPTWVVALQNVDPNRFALFEALSNTQIVFLPDSGGVFDIQNLLFEIAEREVVSVLVEGGALVHGSFLYSGLVDELRLFVAPKILGDGKAWALVEPHLAPTLIKDAIKSSTPSVSVIGEDLLLVSRFGSSREQ